MYKKKSHGSTKYNLYIINARMCKGLSVEEMENANMGVNLGHMLLHNRWIKILNNPSPWIYLDNRFNR